jgi:CRISPR-associated Csx2 family protein
MSTLISFLGKGTQKDGSYRTACYRFDDTLREVSFFGMALTEYLKPDRLILVGTSGSMWDVFFDKTVEEDEDLFALADAVAENSVNSERLEIFSERLSRKMKIPVECLLIDYARDEQGQINLLTRLAEKLSENEPIALDVTHAFRHLPMLALVAARFLARIKKVVVEDIYYGALQMEENGETPVILLKGLLGMLDWVDALASFDKNGDYRVFAKLYKNAGEDDIGTHLEHASFFERINQTGNARKALLEIPGQMPDAPPMIRLFHPELVQRIAWAHNGRHTDRQEAMAWQSLRNGDYLRAATLGFESAISRELQTIPNHDPLNHEQREEAKKRLDTYVNAPGRNRTSIQKAYLDLRELRNALAHGTRSKFSDVQNAMSSESTLRDFLAERLRLIAKLDRHQ